MHRHGEKLNHLLQVMPLMLLRHLSQCPRSLQAPPTKFLGPAQKLHRHLQHQSHQCQRHQHRWWQQVAVPTATPGPVSFKKPPPQLLGKPRPPVKAATSAPSAPAASAPSAPAASAPSAPAASAHTAPAASAHNAAAPSVPVPLAPPQDPVMYLTLHECSVSHACFFG